MRQTKNPFRPPPPCFFLLLRGELRRPAHVLPALALAAALAGIVAATPLVMTPRLTYAASWQALAERVAGNSQCTRIAGFLIIVRTKGCPR